MKRIFKADKKVCRICKKHYKLDENGRCVNCGYNTQFEYVYNY